MDRGVRSTVAGSPDRTRRAADIGVKRDRRGWLRHVAAMSDHRFSTRILAAIAFADSSFLPIPPDLLLIPMGLTRPDRVWRLVIICIIASSLGAVLGYVIGYGLWTTLGAPLVEFYGYSERFAGYKRLVDHWGFWIIIVKAFTPIPFKIAAIAAGVGAMNPVSFMVATVLGRAVHFAMVAVLLVLFGARVAAFIARYEKPLALASVLVLLVIAVGCYLR
jgi:membrane protein YqaA with SNARE-associated domain